MKTAIVVLMMIAPILHAGEPLIVVQDLGGVSALPYYEALNLQPRNVDALPRNIHDSTSAHNAHNARQRSRHAARAQRQANTGVGHAPRH